jgi:hypothetical protein
MFSLKHFISQSVYHCSYLAGGKLLEEAAALRYQAASFGRKKKNVQKKTIALSGLPQPWKGLALLSPHIRFLIVTI